MLYRIKLLTVEHVTVECDSLADADQVRKNIVERANASRHHGETTTGELMVLIEDKERGERLWATIVDG